MTIKTYHVSKLGNEKLSENFKVKEFQCKDGTDKVLIDTYLVEFLQKIRSHFGKPLIILSAYRTQTYNAQVGGTSTSYHTKGMAADIQVKDINPAIVGMYAETLNLGGLGLYSYSNGFLHVDTRKAPYRWLQIDNSGGYEAISKILPTIRQWGTYNTINSVKLVQRKLGVSQSGTFGDITTQAIKKFQHENNLSIDGIVGKQTWTKLFS